MFKNKKGTLRKNQSSSKRATLSQFTKKTLGSGNLKEAVKVPEDEDKLEWLAANCVDFFSEITLLWNLVAEQAQAKYKLAGEGFPPGFEYRWSAGGAAKPIKCSAPEYVDYVLTWVEANMDNEEIFPVRESQPFPDEFETVYVKDIFKRLFRIFAILYHRCFDMIESMDAAAHLNTCFKHFMFFTMEFSLLADEEKKALQGPCARLEEQFREKD